MAEKPDRRSTAWGKRGRGPTEGCLPASNRELRGTEPVGSGCGPGLEGRLSEAVLGGGEMAGPARAGLRGGRARGGAGARGRRAHSRPLLPQPYGDDPHGGAAVEGGLALPRGPQPARNAPVPVGVPAAWAPGRRRAGEGVPAPEPIRAARKPRADRPSRARGRRGVARGRPPRRDG